MEPYTRNGGVIGKRVKYGTSTIPYNTIQYVGGSIVSGLGTASNIVASLTTLTGGLASSPAAGDVVIVAFGSATATNNIAYRIATFTQIADLYGDDTTDVNFQVGYKRMGITPDTSVTITAGTGNTSSPYVIAVSVWRNVDATTPLDVTPTTVSAANTGIVNPPAITPVTSGAMLVVTGASGHTGTTDTFGATYLTNFLTTGRDSTYDITVGIGNVAWTEGTYDPAAWTFTQTDSTAFSTASVTIALRPSTLYASGNKLNSGIWDLATTSSAPRIAGNNVFTQPRDIYAWCRTATANACTISRDTTIETPFNNTPLKMYITGASDPYILTNGLSAYNIAAAAVGQTWEFSVWAMTDLATSGEIYLFEANSSSAWTSTTNITIPLKNYWKQFKVRRTLTDATTAFVQIRLDGQNANGTGASIWFDGLQVRRII